MSEHADPVLHLAPADWIIIGLYASALLWLGIRASRKSSHDTAGFILSGRALTLPAFVAALVSTWYGGILGIGEFTFRFGISNWLVFGAPYYLFALLFAWVFAEKVRRSGVFSIPDTLERAYGRWVALLGSIFVFFISSPAPYVLMQGVLLQVVTGWPLLACILIAAAVSMVSMLAGGLHSVVKMDLLQFTLMFLGFAMLLAFLIPRFGIVPFISLHVPPMHLTATGGNTWQYVIVWFFIALWTLVAPQFHQFTLSAASPQVARRGIVVSVLFWLIFDAMTTLAGLYSRALLPALQDPSMAFPALADGFLPPIAKGIFFLSMAATIMSTTDGLTFISAATLGRDIAARVRRTTDDDLVRFYTRIGIIITAAVAIIGALLFPSVISLWYVIGTLFIPGLLLPVVSAYHESFRLPEGWMFTTMLAGWAASTSAFLYGTNFASHGVPAYPFGIEPMYHGLAAGTIIYTIGRLQSRLTPTEK